MEPNLNDLFPKKELALILETEDIENIKQESKPNDKKQEVKPNDKKQEVKPNDKKQEVKPNDKKQEVKPNDKKQDIDFLLEDIDNNQDIHCVNVENFSISSNSPRMIPKKINKKDKYFPSYVYADIFMDDVDHHKDEKDIEWTDLKKYRFQKCLWKLKYNRIVSTFYLDDLRRREEYWSWMIIVISTVTSGLTVANNVEDEPIDNYNTAINALLTLSSMSTSLIAAWIKKQRFIEKINDIDKYLLNINALCEELEVQFSLLNTDRTSYIDFKKKYIPEITKFLTTNPMIPPANWKECIREITLKYPELVDPDNTEDNKLWPWYGDLEYDVDDYNNHGRIRKPTTFMEHFKKTNTQKIMSTCCFPDKNNTLKNIY